MATPDPSRPLDAAAVVARLSAVEDAVHEVRFQHMVKVDAATNGLGIVYGRLQHVQQELTGFRAEVAAEFGALRSDVTVLKSDVGTLKTDLAAVKDAVAEILRRLPPPANQ